MTPTVVAISTISLASRRWWTRNRRDIQIYHTVCCINFFKYRNTKSPCWTREPSWYLWIRGSYKCLLFRWLDFLYSRLIYLGSWLFSTRLFLDDQLAISLLDLRLEIPGGSGETIYQNALPAESVCVQIDSSKKYLQLTLK